MALNSRVVVDRAKGVIAQTLGPDMSTAFDRLRSYCRNRNLGLVVTARQIAERGVDARILVDRPD